LITDKQEVYANTVNDSIYADINQRLAFNWEVKNDLKAYIENTADARSKLKAEAQQWNAAGKQVRDMYSAAWNMQIAETKFTPATATAPASIKLDNSSKVTGAYRVAAQADQNLGNDIIGDIMNYT